jgi:tryptophan 2,3-dioxygenase
VATVHTVAEWLKDRDPHTFPYESVVRRFHRVGKHFVERELLDSLCQARAVLPVGSTFQPTPLEPFLDTALDKYDGRYDYLTYTGLSLLPLPGRVGCASDGGAALRQRNRLVCVLVTDALRFEQAAVAGATRFLPQMRPDRRTVAKRCRLGLRVNSRMSGRNGGNTSYRMQDPVKAAQDWCAAVRQSQSAPERIALRLSMLPVYVVHDEYLFIRVLQSFEATFALLVVQLSAAVAALEAGDPARATMLVDAARSALQESAPLFSMLATMRVESFRRFRQFTDGASAIQSVNYKRMESLCRLPDYERLESQAYQSVPAVRSKLLAGDQHNLESAYLAARARGWLPPARDDAFRAATARFASVLRHWRSTHYHLALRMLGDVKGTGQTEGPPYLRKVLDVPIFGADLAAGFDGRP